jgi:MFS family permease
VAEQMKFYGWSLLAVLFSLDFINMGFPYYGATVINGYMIRELPMSRSTLGLGFTIINLAVGLGSVLAAYVLLKIGLRATFLLGSAVICAGALFMGLYAYKPWHYLVAFGVVIGAGISFATLVPATTAVTRWFRKYRGRAMGVAVSASGFAGLLVSPFLDKMLRTAGGNWRAGWDIVAGAAVLAGLLAVTFVRESPESMGQLPDGLPVEAQERPSRTDKLATKHAWTAGQAYRTSAYWLVALAGIMATYPFFFLVAHWILRLRGAGISSADAAWAMGVFTFGTLVGRWLGGTLMDFLNARLAYVLGMSFYFIASYLAIIVSADALTMAYVAALLFGAAYGWTFTCWSTITAHYFGPKAFPKLYGTMILLTSAIASPAGYVGGKIFDVYHTYTPAFELNCLLAAVGIVAILFAVMPRPGAEVPTETPQAAAH